MFRLTKKCITRYCVESQRKHTQFRWQTTGTSTVVVSAIWSVHNLKLLLVVCMHQILTILWYICTKYIDTCDCKNHALVAVHLACGKHCFEIHASSRNSRAKLPHGSLDLICMTLFWARQQLQLALRTWCMIEQFSMWFLPFLAAACVYAPRFKYRKNLVCSHTCFHYALRVPFVCVA
jgi:hypothetical protein